MQTGKDGQTNENLITIITKSEIRYEGILYNINPQDQSITLRNVRSFGTEGRRPADEIGPSPQTHEYIVFRGADIKDLKVLEGEQAQQQQPTEKISSSQSIEKASANTETQQTTQPTTTTTEEKPRQQNNRQNQQHQQHQQHHDNRNKIEYHPKLREPETSKEDFDYETTNAKFQQLQTQDLKKSETEKKYYSHDDFFDSLSSTAVEKDTPLPRAEQKKIDQDTFGSAYVDRGNRGNKRGGNRGGYRGGHNNRGGNRGGNRQGGGYRNYNNNNNNNEEGGEREYKVYTKKN